MVTGRMIKRGSSLWRRSNPMDSRELPTSNRLSQHRNRLKNRRLSSLRLRLLLNQHLHSHHNLLSQPSQLMIRRELLCHTRSSRTLHQSHLQNQIVPSMSSLLHLQARETLARFMPISVPNFTTKGCSHMDVPATRRPLSSFSRLRGTRTPELRNSS